ncbi:glycosyltransferase family 2 protein [Roseobacter sp. CCS2]|uniref:glycosyltransferase family 2 protein n=1 Tax=Roseobacter sp. CCS2 TaxID=391593 RepID=UPI0000F3C58A|nr:glycosyltransferase family 2 protein [Roseobacter sp. CCS2]EBA11554.1 glycosyltransferase, succinoglycan biosynthesis protein exoa [Roseobacter sp. CCS2]
MSDLTDTTNRIADPLIVIPCLNEAMHIGTILSQLRAAMDRLGGRVVVVDGGSTDGTIRIVQECAAADDRIALLHNSDRIQSAAINMAVAMDDGRATHLIRIDAHCAYPDDYCDILLQQARSVYADSIVVSMVAQGDKRVQRINAATQNAPIGNGGSAHRNVPSGAYVDHGHHALIKIAAFQAVGGYDPNFAHNEDAELDYRLRQAGYRIWLTAATVVTYFPRPSLMAAGRQYFFYGAGRASNLLKHRIRPRIRQAKVMMVAPAVLLALLGPVHWLFAIPAALWAAYCIVTGLRMAWEQRDLMLTLCGPVAMIMHFSWSLGFWQRVLRSTTNTRSQVTQ